MVNKKHVSQEELARSHAERLDDVIDSITHQDFIKANLENFEVILRVNHDSLVLFSREVGEYEVGMTFG
jgi:hypothetical protein